MKSKLSFLVAILLLTASLNAQTWQIFTPDYSYTSGKINLDKVIRSRNIIDVIKADDGTIWLACGDSYPIYIKNLDNYDKTSYEVGLWNPAKMKEINYVPSENTRFMSSPNGTVWLLTRKNLLRMVRGNAWEGFNADNTNKAQQSTIAVPEFDMFGDITKDSQGNIWISGATSGKNTCGLAKLENNSWTYFRMPEEITSKLISKSKKNGFISGKDAIYAEKPALRLILRDLNFDKKGNIWMSIGDYQDEGLCKFANGQFTIYNEEGGNLASDNVLDIDVNNEGRVHLATSKGFFVAGDDEKLIPFKETYLPSLIAFDNRNQLWWSGKIKREQTTGKSLRILIEQNSEDVSIIRRYDMKSGKSYDFDLNNTPLLNDITRLYIDQNDVKYFISNGTKTGLFILDDTFSGKFKGWNVISHYKDGEDAIATHYVTTGVNDKSWNFTGIASYYSDKYLLELSGDKLAHSAFTLTGEPTGLLSSPLKVEGIARDKNNTLYLGTTNYIYKYDKVSNPVEGFEKSKISKLVNCMATDQDGKIWIGTAKGLAYYDGSKFTYFDKSKNLPGNIILSILSDSKNRKWIGTYNGVLCIENEKETIYDKKTGLSNNRIMALAENSSGTVFIASSNMYTECKSLNYEVDGAMKEEQLPKPEKVYTMVFDKNDNLWIGCQGCLLCRNNKGEYKVYNKDNSPIDPTYNLDRLFVIGNEIWLSVNLPIQDQSSLSPVAKDGPSAKELEALNSLKPKLQGLQPSELVLIFQPAAQQ